MPDAAVTTELILKLLPLAIQAFGAVSAEVMQLRAAAGLSDEELLSQAQQTDQKTLDLVQQHLDALAAAEQPDNAPEAPAETPEASPTPEPASAAATTPSETTPAAEQTSAPTAKLTRGGALVHGQ